MLLYWYNYCLCLYYIRLQLFFLSMTKGEIDTALSLFTAGIKAQIQGEKLKERLAYIQGRYRTTEKYCLRFIHIKIIVVIIKKGENVGSYVLINDKKFNRHESKSNFSYVKILPQVVQSLIYTKNFHILLKINFSTFSPLD